MTQTVDRIPYFGISLARLTVSGFMETVRVAVKEGRTITCSYAHFHSINLIHGSDRVRDTFRELDIVSPDGALVLWSSWLLGRPVFRDNILLMEYAMAVLGPEACDRGWSLFIFGGEVGIAERAAERLRSRFIGLRVVGTHHGQMASVAEMEHVVTQIADLRPTILLVGLGQPKQEEWIVRYQPLLGVNAIIGVGGYLEKLARRDTVYPPWVNRTHLYWLYRLVTEPGRVWKRYSLGGLKFFWLLTRCVLLRRPGDTVAR